MKNRLIDTYYTGTNAINYNRNRSAANRTHHNDKWFWENDILQQYLDGQDHKFTILDAPVGTGRFFGLYDKFSSVVGVDYSVHMLAEAAKEQQTTKNKNITLLHMNMVEEGPSHTYNILVCFRLLNLLPICDAVQTLNNTLPKIDKGGLISVRDVGADYNGESILKEKIHMHSRETLHQTITDLGFLITKEHVYSQNRKPGRYCVYEIKRS